MTTINPIKLKVMVNPDINIIRKIAADYERRATTHTEHYVLYQTTGLNIDNITSYFVSALWRKARAIRLSTEGSSIPDRKMLNKLWFPAGFCRHIMSIGNIRTSEYVINVEEERIPVDESIHSNLREFLLDDDEMREISEKLFQLSSFMPTYTSQYKFDNDGDEAMFGIVDVEHKFFDEDCVTVRSFTNQAVDEKYLEITALLGLKVAGSNSPILYPNLGSIRIDAIRIQFTAEDQSSLGKLES